MIVKLIPHWTLTAGLLIASFLIVLVEVKISSANTLIQTNASCSVGKTSYSEGSIYAVEVQCGNINTDVRGATFIESLLVNHTKTIQCARLYDNGTIEDCVAKEN